MMDAKKREGIVAAERNEIAEVSNLSWPLLNNNAKEKDINLDVNELK